MKVDVLLGLQWGDEGKGKIVDVLAPKYDVIARFQGGPNAGHTIEFEGRKFILRTIPSGIFYGDKINIIGNGAIVDPRILLMEIKGLQKEGFQVFNNLKISRKTHLILPTHRMLDAVYEAAKGKNKIGSTLKGIGPTYTDKVARLGIRIGDAIQPNFKEKYEKIKAAHLRIVGSYDFDPDSFILDGLSFDEYEREWMASLESLKGAESIDSEYYINNLLQQGKSILAEGAQGSLLDIDFGSYPFVTSSNTTIAGVCSGLGVAPSRIGRVFGIVKAYCTRVGSGPFPTELFDETGKKLQIQGNEFGSVTGRVRRCGWLDIPALKYAVMINGVTDIILTKADVMNNFKEIRICTQYVKNGKIFDYIPFEVNDIETELQSMEGWNCDLEGLKFDQLPINFANYIHTIEKLSGVKVSMISAGPDRNQIIWR
ncbi:MAG: adenylosuccinate synthase [Bacteroidales bacterium]|jgi:adenylosuccinate synthase|nr:adenylosuccinate synthase [Bacteroidales bacterium]